MSFHVEALRMYRTGTQPLLPTVCGRIWIERRLSESPVAWLADFPWTPRGAQGRASATNRHSRRSGAARADLAIARMDRHCASRS